MNMHTQKSCSWGIKKENADKAKERRGKKGKRGEIREGGGGKAG